MKRLRVVFLVLCGAMLACAFAFERHEVVSLDEKGKKTAPGARPPAQAVDGLAFTREAAVEGFLREGGVLYDAYSLRAFSSQPDAKLDVEKECPT